LSPSPPADRVVAHSQDVGHLVSHTEELKASSILQGPLVVLQSPTRLALVPYVAPSAPSDADEPLVDTKAKTRRPTPAEIILSLLRTDSDGKYCNVF